MGLLNSFRGGIAVRITTAAPEALLYALNTTGICLRNVQYLDDLTVSLEIERKDYNKVYHLAEKAGAEIKIFSRSGVYWSIRRLVSRPVLLAGTTLLFLLTLLLPTRILFVEIDGNDVLPDSLILEGAELCGIRFGASRRSVRSEATKNKLLSLLPELRWAGVNTRGCVAVVSVREKPVTQPKTDSGAIRHIVAAKDGIISDMTILRGVGQCRVGQAVKKGQILVSGYIDHGISLEGTCADAEITGYTGNVFYMLTPTQRRVRRDPKQTKTKYSILIGKKLINFRKGSGISDTECVRMYEGMYLTLPGGFRLPLALIAERTVSYTMATQNVENADAYTWVRSAAEDYLRSQMLSGEILRSNILTEIGDGAHVLYGTYQCRELIGRIRSEEKLITDEQRS